MKLLPQNAHNHNLEKNCYRYTNYLGKHYKGQPSGPAPNTYEDKSSDENERKESGVEGSKEATPKDYCYVVHLRNKKMSTETHGKRETKHHS